MVSKPLDEEDIFKVACKIQSLEARDDYLKQACGDDAALFDRVAVLLRMHEEEPGFLESPPVAVVVTIDEPRITERPGTVIGPYKLLQQIGEGGMGTVFMAEQTHPVQRKVALKVIKPGMDSRQVTARFETERQALAMMDHVNIARGVEKVGIGVPTAQRGKARTALIKLLNKIENTGKAIGRDLGDEAVIASFNLEPAYSHMADEELITSADALKTAATPHSAAFQARGFSATFLTDLQTKRDAFHDTMAGGSTVEATATIVQKIARVDIIVEQFDVTVGNVYDEDDPAKAPKRAAYDSARTVIRVRTQPLEVTLSVTRSGNTVSATITLSRQAQAAHTVTPCWCEQGSTGVFTDGPVTSMSAGTITASPTVTVTTANPLEVVARVIRGDGSQFDSTAVLV